MPQAKASAWAPECSVVAMVLAILVAASVAEAQNVPANPFPVWVTQPDTKIKFLARVRGDEHQAWMETIDGYTILRNLKHCTGTDTSSCWWEYALSAPDGRLIPSGVVVTATGNIKKIPAERRPLKGLRPGT